MPTVERAVALARQAGDAATASRALTNIGAAQWNAADPAAKATLDEALRVALEAGDVEDACRAYVCLGWNLLDWFRLDEADWYISAGMKLAEESEFSGFLAYLQVERARLQLARGGCGRGSRSAESGTGAPVPMKCAALTALGRIGVQHGRPRRVQALVGSAWNIATRSTR